jgi:hypothetical protein
MGPNKELRRGRIKGQNACSSWAKTMDCHCAKIQQCPVDFILNKEAGYINRPLIPALEKTSYSISSLNSTTQLTFSAITDKA